MPALPDKERIKETNKNRGSNNQEYLRDRKKEGYKFKKWFISTKLRLREKF